MSKSETPAIAQIRSLQRSKYEVYANVNVIFKNSCKFGVYRLVNMKFTMKKLFCSFFA